MNRRTTIALIASACAAIFFAVQYVRLERQLLAAKFIDHEARTLPVFFVDHRPSVDGIARRLGYLMRVFGSKIETVHEPVLRRGVEVAYRQAVTNAVTTLRRMTNDLGDDPVTWVNTYGK